MSMLNFTLFCSQNYKSLKMKSVSMRFGGLSAPLGFLQASVKTSKVAIMIHFQLIRAMISRLRSRPVRFSSLKAKRPALLGESFVFGDPDENRTRVTAVKGRCLSRLTTGPYLVAEGGFEPPTPRV